MDQERWQRVKELFEAASELPRERWQAYLGSNCPADEELRGEVLSLLEASAPESDPLEKLTPADFGDALPEDDAGALRGRVVGSYRLEQHIGSGGMATVFLGRRADQQFEQQVAIKFLKPGFDTGSLLRRFLNERQTLANLNHPNIARLLDGGTTEDGQPYLVMEYIAGQPLLQYCQERRLDLAERLALFLKVCAAVSYAHRNLVVHRDLKPANILVTAAGEPKLLDFGIAKILDPKLVPGAAELTVAPLMAMTPEYASPEQVRGQPITTASDVYSLGVILYELLAGSPPYRVDSRSIHDIERVVCDLDPPRPSAAAAAGGIGAAALAGDLDAIALMALRKEPERRYASVEALAGDLQRYAQGLPVHAQPDSFSYRTGKFLKRHRVGVSASALLLLSLLGGIAGTTWQARRAAREAGRANDKASTLMRVTGFLFNLFDSTDVYENPVTKDTPLGEFLERGVRKIDSELRDDVPVRAEVLTAMGKAFRGVSEQRAEEMLREAVELQRGRGAAGQEGLAEALHWWGIVQRRLGQAAAAEAAHREALEIRRRLFGGDSEPVAATLNVLALSLLFQGEYQEAEQALLEAHRLYSALGGEKSAEAAKALNNLGALYRGLERYGEALASFEEVLRIYRSIHGEEHAAVAMAWNNVGITLETRAARAAEPAAAAARQDLERAEQCFRASLDIWRRLKVAESNPEVLGTRNNLALTLYQMDRVPDALEEVEGALALARAALPADHPTLRSLEETRAEVRKGLK